MRKELIEGTKKLVAEELEAANRKFRQNASTHESYAVTLEEAQEAEAELKNVAQMLSVVWEMTKQNAPKEQLEEAVTQLEEAATRMAAKSIQTAAMAQKFKQFLNGAANGTAFISAAAAALPNAEKMQETGQRAAGVEITITGSPSEAVKVARWGMQEARRMRTLR